MQSHIYAMNARPSFFDDKKKHISYSALSIFFLSQQVDFIFIAFGFFPYRLKHAIRPWLGKSKLILVACLLPRDCMGLNVNVCWLIAVRPYASQQYYRYTTMFRRNKKTSPVYKEWVNWRPTKST